ncbi:MAG TPA: amidohydrolase [Propionibacteriaceae bacterium]|nr:amidohydrolase family protein [Micropruina sp.]HBX82841.1 amidohydrolase [Propionibacteriaceae bacterium]HBY23410.1 amidohydrolase [Propionibacteriaceae bacterium]
MEPSVSFTHSHDGTTHSHQVVIPDGPSPRLHLHGTVLPDGEPRDLWIVDGRFSFTPVPDAVTVHVGGWILPGLVDAHCHVGLEAHGGVPSERAEQHAVADREAGALLLRDAGSPVDTRWIDEREDLPEIIRAGRHIARPKRYIRNFAEEVEPEELVAEVVTQAQRGDGWVKLVGDWIDRDTGDLTPLWPQAVAAEAIAAAHEHGARVTAHCFDEHSAEQLVAAGIDGIEHGSGLNDATIAAMAERGVALVPTLINIENFPKFAAAGEGKFPAYAAHMRAMYGARKETYGKALDAGVPIYAGTDAGGVLPHGLIGRELLALAEIGGAEFALGAGSWRAREWLGRPALVEGAQADLVVYDTDPLADITTVLHPALIILRGHIVGGARVR